MATRVSAHRARAAANTSRAYAMGLGRAFAGAIIFGLPLLMTQEMWSLGFTADPARLALLLVVNFAILVGLSQFGGFERTTTLGEDVLDAAAAFAVGAFASALVLLLFDMLEPGMPSREAIGKVAIQAIPASFGAMLARKQLGGGDSDAEEARALRRSGYAGELFLMGAGSLFLAFNIAPTEEIILIGYMTSPLQLIGLVFVSLLLLHMMVYSVGFIGQESAEHDLGRLRSFATHSVAGYAIVLGVSLYVLWTFGRAEGESAFQIVAATIVLGLPASVGASIARLVV